MPLPTMKQNANRICGVTRPSHASTESAVAPVSAIDSDTSATMRRPYKAAMAPPRLDISLIGDINHVLHSPALLAHHILCVIPPAAPTPPINNPRLDTRHS